jgi:hypothetical protein
MSSAELGPEKECIGEVQQQLYLRDPSSRQIGSPIITTPQLSKETFYGKENKNWTRPQMVARHQDRLAY